MSVQLIRAVSLETEDGAGQFINLRLGFSELDPSRVYSRVDPGIRGILNAILRLPEPLKAAIRTVKKIPALLQEASKAILWGFVAKLDPVCTTPDSQRSLKALFRLLEETGFLAACFPKLFEWRIRTEDILTMSLLCAKYTTQVNFAAFVSSCIALRFQAYSCVRHSSWCPYPRW